MENTANSEKDDRTRLGQVNDNCEPEKEFPGFVTLMLWITIVGSSLSVIRYVAGLFIAYSHIMSLANGLLSILTVLHVLGLCLLKQCKKVGFYLMSITYVLAIAVNVHLLHSYAELWALAPIVILLWWAILQIRKNGVSAWRQLTGGWDLRNFKTEYIISLSIIVILIILIPIAVHRSSNLEGQLEHYTMPNYGSNGLSGISNQSYNAIEVSSVYEKTEAKSGQDKTTTQKAESFLRSAIEETNKDYPEEISTGITMTKIYIEGDYVVYVAKCDEDLIDIELFAQYRDEMTESMKEDILNCDPLMAYFIRLCTNANKGIAYKYVGDKSGKSFTIRFSCSDLLKLK